MLRTVVYIILAVVLLIVYVRMMERLAAFAPSRSVQFTPRDVGLSYEEVRLKTPDGVTLDGWFVPVARGAPSLLFLHGNAGDIGGRVDKVAMFHQLGLNVLIVDYRGYGRSSGRPSERGLYTDAAAAYDYLASRPDVDPGRIVVYGASLGGAVAVDVASRRKPAAVILDSTFTSAADMGRVIMPVIPSFLIHMKFDSLDKIRMVTAPKLFIHSPDDETVPYRLGRKLYEAAPEPKRFLKTTGSHNEGYAFSRQAYIEEIRDFLTDYHVYPGKVKQ